MTTDQSSRIENFLEAECQKYELTSRKYARADKGLGIALTVCSIISLVLTSGTMGSACSGVGIVASLPLGTLACLCAASTIVLSLVAKRFARKKKKHRDTVRLARTYKSRVQALESDGADFPLITRCLKDYYDEKDRLRQPSPSTSPP